ncbi:MAG: OmpP1/FadL family transporter [Kiritimatiellia bacterium]
MKKAMIALVGMGVAASAVGAGFGIYEGSARGNAMGGAVIGDVSDATAAYHNPANIAFSTNIQIAAGVTFINPYCDTEVEHKSQGRMNPGWFTVPTFYATIPLPFDLAFGWGNYTEFGLGSKYGRHWDLAGDTQQTTLEQITLNPTLAYKITDWWSVAAGPRISWIRFRNHKQPYSGESIYGTDTSGLGLYDYTIEDAFNLDAKLKGDDWGAGWMAATTFKPHQRVSVGLVYRSRIRHKISGDFKLHGTAGGYPNVSVNEEAVATLLQSVYRQAYAGALQAGMSEDMAAGFAQNKMQETQQGLDDQLNAAKKTWQGQKIDAYSRASARIRLPDSLTLGANWDVTDRYRVGSSITYTRWSSVDQISFHIGKDYSYRLPLKWRDTVRVGFGMEYDFTNWLAGRIGYTFDEDPTSKSHQSTMLPGGDRHIIGIGSGFKITENLRLDLGYNFIRMNNEHYYIKTTDYYGNTSKKYLSCHNGFSHLVSASICYSF